MNEALKKPEKYRKKYMRSHTMIALLLDNERDSDIIEWLNKQRNRSKAIRELIRKEADNERYFDARKMTNGISRLEKKRN